MAPRVSQAEEPQKEAPERDTWHDLGGAKIGEGPGLNPPIF